MRETNLAEYKADVAEREAKADVELVDVALDGALIFVSTRTERDCKTSTLEPIIMKALHYVVVLRDQLDRLAALARSGDAPAQQALCAITNWDAEGRCINCKQQPLALPEAFILVLQDDDKTWGAGICSSCVEDESKLKELAREHVRRAYPSMQIVKPGSA